MENKFTVHRDIVKEVTDALFGGDVKEILLSNDEPSYGTSGRVCATIATETRIHALNSTETSLLKALLELDQVRTQEMATAVRRYEELLTGFEKGNTELRTALGAAKGQAGQAVTTGLDLALENAKLRAQVNGYARTIRIQSGFAANHGQEVLGLAAKLVHTQEELAKANEQLKGSDRVEDSAAVMLAVLQGDFDRYKAEAAELITSLSQEVTKVKELNTNGGIQIHKQSMSLTEQAKQIQRLTAENTKLGKALAEKNALDEGDRVAKDVLDKTSANLRLAQQAVETKTKAIAGLENLVGKLETSLAVETSFRKTAEKNVRSLRAKLGRVGKDTRPPLNVVITGGPRTAAEARRRRK